MAREFLMLAHVYDPKKHNPAHWFVSEKLDGMRCFWDGGISRNLPVSEVPWANTTKDARYVSPPIATGLWSRYGKAIQAPKWFLDRLPPIPLDGELWMGRGNFQKVMSTVKDLNPGPAWEMVKYMVFDCPSYGQVFANGEIKLKKRFEKKFEGIMRWVEARMPPYKNFLYETRTFMNTQKELKAWSFFKPDGFMVHDQQMLSHNLEEAKKQLENRITQILELGGEGVMLRNPTSLWAPSRSWALLKYKPCQDSEGTVVGFTWGRETDLGSKLLGKMGALIVEWQGKRFKLSGFTDEEREVRGLGDIFSYGAAHQGEENTNWEMHPRFFKPGDIVTFTYRELTNEGIPKEARYLRKRDDE